MDTKIPYSQLPVSKVPQVQILKHSNPWLVESVNAEPMATEGQLCFENRHPQSKGTENYKQNFSNCQATLHRS